MWDRDVCERVIKNVCEDPDGVCTQVFEVSVGDAIRACGGGVSGGSDNG